MEENENTEDTNFGELKLLVSKWFDQNRCVNMKVLYRDHIPNISELNSCSKTMDFIDLLIGSGNLSQSDVTILYDTIAITKQFGLENELKRKLPSLPIPNLRNHVVTKFIPHRQRLVKLGMVLTQPHVDQISVLYNLEKCEDGWSLILELEDRMIICERKMEEFIEKLKKHELLHAVKVLTEDIEDTNFRELKLLVSRWFDEHRCVNMKVLYRDHVPNISALNSCSKAMDFIDLLIGSGNLSQSDFTILYDTITLTKQFGLENELKRKLPSLPIPNLKNHVVTYFTPHRQRLVKFGMILTPHHVDQISVIYNLESYEDGWSLILDLEDRMIICEGQLVEFIDTLNKHELFQAVKALTEGAVLSVTLCKRKLSSHCENQPPSKKHFHESHPSLQTASYEECEVNQPSTTTALQLINKLHRNKATLMLGDMEIAFHKLRDIVSYYQQYGFQLENTTSGSLIFHLFTYYPNALKLLWKLHQSGKLLKDLAEILVAKEHVQDFANKWMTWIDEPEYKVALSKLQRKGSRYTEENLKRLIGIHKDSGGLKQYVSAMLHRKCFVGKENQELQNEMESEQGVIKSRYDETKIRKQSFEKSHHSITQEKQLPVAVEDVIDDICNSLRRFCNQVIDKRKINNEDIIDYMKGEQYQTWPVNTITTFKGINIGKMFAHVLIASYNEANLLDYISEYCTDDVVEDLSAECHRLRFQYSVTELICYGGRTFGSSFLIHFLSNAPMIHTLLLSDGVITFATVNYTVDALSIRGIILELGHLDIHHSNLTNIKGSSLATLLTIAPKLKHLNMSNCNLSGNIMDDMINECNMKGVVLELNHLDINHNNLSNVKGSSLGALLAIAPKLKFINMSNCRLSGAVIDDMVNECTMKEIVLKLVHLNIHHNNLSEVEGSSLGTLLTIAPKLKHLKMSSCRLSGFVMDDMVNECTMKGAVLELTDLDIHYNDLWYINGSSLCMLLTLAPKLEYLIMRGCSLSGPVLDDMANECTLKGVVLELDHLDIHYNFLYDIKASSIFTLLTIAPKLKHLDISYYSLSASTMDDIADECTMQGVVLELEHLNLHYNNLNNVRGSSLATLLTIAPKLKHLNISTCSLSGVIIDDMVKECVLKEVVLELSYLNICYNNLIDINGSSLTTLLAITPKLKYLKTSGCKIPDAIFCGVNEHAISRGVYLSH